MCYDIKTSLQSQLKYAKRKTPELVAEIEEIIKPHQEELEFNWHHVSGFAHPKMLIFTNTNGISPEIAQWGLVPRWTKNVDAAKKFWNNTLNARVETIFEKPSFRDAAKTNRCLIVVDGFFEHHHANGKTYPYYFQQADQSPLILAGIWSEWIDQTSGEIWKTFTIATTKGNRTFERIHNNPKLKEPRMPVILSPENEAQWLDANQNEEQLSHLFSAKEHSTLINHTVKRVRGKDYIGNTPEITAEHNYSDLVIQGNLFD